MEKTLCVICAWRENCQKRFMRRNDISLRCPDFVRDITIKDEESVNDKGGDKKET
ncbi:MAG: hypothetical protein NZ583_02690 [Desulfobacterota bacterium]|nr:hypothetical protein [Thermodesulfobacteriota bacterium]MDW8001792.1 hypothetical protein [Deltaproteobacteria bacterium]